MKVFNLINGQALTGTVVEETLSDYIVENIVQILLSETGLVFQEYMPYKEGNTAPIGKDFVISIVELDSKVEAHYKQMINPSTIQTPDKEIILPN